MTPAALRSSFSPVNVNDLFELVEEPQLGGAAAQYPVILAGEQGWKAKTSVKISNIPCRITQDNLAETISECGFEGTWDFLYVPNGGRSGRARSVNLGYGFVNFLSDKDCLAFASCFEGFRFEGTNGRNPCSVRPAKSQGVSSLIQMESSILARAGVRSNLHNRPIIRQRGPPVQPESSWLKVNGELCMVFHL